MIKLREGYKRDSRHRYYRPNEKGKTDLAITSHVFKNGKKEIRIYCTRGARKSRWHRVGTIKGCLLGTVEMDIRGEQ